MDANFVRQGEPGYSNEIIVPGDLLVSINDREASKMSVFDLHSILIGNNELFLCV